MDLLILGGTRFLGRHLARQALDAGHRVTLLHRGVSGPALFPEAEHLIADRNGDLSVLAGRRWDVAIDTSAYVPRQVRAVAAALGGLGGRVGQYQLVSTISVYAEFDPAGQDEDATLQTLADPSTETVDGKTYGGLKALCEAEARSAFGAHCLIARPGLLVGPHDPTGRWSWWVRRYARAAADEAVLAPGDAAVPAQFIDARDAAAWLLARAAHGGGGRFNLTGPLQPLTLGGFFETLRGTLAPRSRIDWVDEAFLLGHDVQPWTELPVWLPLAQSGLHRISIARAVAAGLACRPLARTITDTAAWLAAGLVVEPPGVGMDPNRERELLAAWHAAG